MARLIDRPALAVCLALAGGAALVGCAKPSSYGIERRIAAPVTSPQVWAVAPAVNLSGEEGVDPLLQADLLYGRLQNVHGITAVPVNRVAEAYLVLGIGGISSPADAAQVCEVLGVDALVVPSVTLYSPYDPPTMGASLQVFAATGGALRSGRLAGADAVRGLSRTASADSAEQMLPPPGTAGSQMVQQVGVFDARDGSVRRAADRYAHGRHDPEGPGGGRDVFLVMDRYAGFVYHALLADLMDEIARRRIAGGRAEAASPAQVPARVGRLAMRE